MKAPITAAQAMLNPTVVETINTLSQLADKLRVERDTLLEQVEKAEKDAERYRWLRERYTAVNFDWEESGQQAVIFTADDFPIATASCDETIDRAMEASK